MSDRVPESAFEDSPSPQPQAGPSSSRNKIDEAFKEFDVESFDWKAYEGTYKGRSLITRLTHIPNLILTSPGTTDPKTLLVARTALLRAIPHIKETWDHRLYLQCISQINQTLGRSTTELGAAAVDSDDEGEEDGDGDEPMIGEGEEADGKADMAWIHRVKEEEKKEMTKTEIDLRGYMSNLIKESIRVTHLAVAQMAIKSGDHLAALKAYGHARDYSSSPNHQLEQGLGVLETCLMFNKIAPLTSVIGKLGATVERAYPAPVRSKTTGDAGAITANDIRQDQERKTQADHSRIAVNTKLAVAEALIALQANKSFNKAGQAFARANKTGLGDWEGQVISNNDVALLEGLCILATGSRSDIRDDLLSANSFRSALADDQGWLLEAVRLSTEAQYGEMIKLIQKATPTLLLNQFLAPYLSNLMDLIRNRAIIQYIQPFSSISLPTMSSSLGMSEDTLLAEIEQLVEKGKISGRIDLIDQVLHVKAEDVRQDAYKSALDVGKSITASTRAAIIRMKMQEAKITVTPVDSSTTSLAPTDSAVSPNDEAQNQEEGVSNQPPSL